MMMVKFFRRIIGLRLHFSPGFHRPVWGFPRYAKRPGRYGIPRPMFGSAYITVRFPVVTGR